MTQPNTLPAFPVEKSALDLDGEYGKVAPTIQ